VVLVARRQGALDEVATAIRAGFGVDTRSISVDFTGHDAMARIVPVEAIANLSNGPTWFVGEQVREGARLSSNRAAAPCTPYRDGGSAVRPISFSHEHRQDIADILVRYATGIDRRDWALFRTCLTDDCDADYGDIGVWHGADAPSPPGWRSHTPGVSTRCMDHQPGPVAERRRCQRP